MEMNWKLRGILALVLALSLTAGLFMPTAAVAADPPGWLVIKLDKEGAIKSYLNSDNEISMSLYKVASLTREGDGWSTTVSGAFSGFQAKILLAKAELEQTQKDRVDKTAQEILNDSSFRKAAQNSAPIKTQTLDKSSDPLQFEFTYLEPGIYYAMAKGPDGLLIQTTLVPIPWCPISTDGSSSELFSLSVDAKVLKTYPLKATKRMEGRDFYPGDEFTFKLTVPPGAPTPVKDGKEVTEVTITPVRGNEEEIDFGELMFTQAHAGNNGSGIDYTYTITETAEHLKDRNIKPIVNEQYVTFNVSKNSQYSGELTVIQKNEEPPVLVNHYNYTAFIPIYAYKQLQGRNFIDDDFEGNRWTFSVDPQGGARRARDYDEVEALKPADGVYTPEIIEKLWKTREAKPVLIPKSEGNSAAINLGYLLFNENDVGEHTYRITEANEKDHVTNDKFKDVHVTVSYNPDTYQLEVVSDYGAKTENVAELPKDSTPDRVTFKNKYTATGEITFEGLKELEGIEKLGREKLLDQEFAFEIEENGKVLQTVYNDPDGKILFEPIMYTQDAEHNDVTTHTYHVREIVNKDYDQTATIKNQEKPYTVKISVTDDGHGKLTATQVDGYANPFKLNFKNEVLTGNLVVSKRVVYNELLNNKLNSKLESDKMVEFPFTVVITRNGQPINGTFGDDVNAITFTNGTATFTLKQGESKAIKGLPLGTVYKVKEEMTGAQQGVYTLSGITTSGTTDATRAANTANAEVSGTIVTGTAAAQYTNERNLADLTLVKVLEEENQLPEDLDKEFTFTVTMADKETLIKGEDIFVIEKDENGKETEKPYTAPGFDSKGTVSGTVTIKTKANTPVVIKNLPVGMNYTITEKEVPFFVPTDAENSTGTIPQAGITATLTNKRDVKPVSLTVTKTVESTTTDTTAFTFTVTLNPWNGMTLSGQFGDMNFTNGVATFTLRSGESRTATGLPSGISYTVTEAEIANYVQTQATGVSGTINAGAPLGADRVAAFTNTRITTPAGGGGGGGGGGGVRPNPTATPAPTEPPEPDQPTENPPVDETVTVTGHKTWDDNDNAAGQRPASITIHLFADSAAAVEEVASRTVTEAEGWSWTFTDLPAVDSYNLPIDYSIVEDPVPGYTATYSGYDVINSMPTELTSATVIKNWDDGDDENHLMRPTSLRATLYGDNNVVSTVILNEGNGWSATVDELPAYRNGSRIAYTWREQEALGYVQTGIDTDGTVTTITNTLWQLVPPPDGTNPGPRPGNPEDEIDDYGTPLGLGIIINHVGDCFD